MGGHAVFCYTKYLLQAYRPDVKSTRAAGSAVLSFCVSVAEPRLSRIKEGMIPHKAKKKGGGHGSSVTSNVGLCARSGTMSFLGLLVG